MNAEPDAAFGYNDLKNDADKVRIFDGALSAMEARYKPDLILIACNTLSVVWPRTEHAKTGGVETVEIVGLGADLIRKELAAKPDATALVFATKTTIESEAHKKLLVAQGVAADHVVGEACPKLAGAIERGAASDGDRRLREEVRRRRAGEEDDEGRPSRREPQLHALRLREAPLGAGVRRRPAIRA